MKKRLLIIISITIILMLFNTDISNGKSNIKAMNYNQINQEKITTSVIDALTNKSTVDVAIVLNDDGTLNWKAKTVEEGYRKINYAKIEVKNKQYRFSSKYSESELKIKNKYKTIPGLYVTVSRDALLKLIQDPMVKKVYIPPVYSVVLEESVPLINADKVWQKSERGIQLTGKDTTVCIVDSGIDYRHHAFGACPAIEFLSGNCNKVVGGHDFINDDNDPFDDNSHGTHVSGIIASENNKYRGVSYDSKIVMAKVTNTSGGTEGNSLADGIDWCIDHAEEFNISVISISLASHEVHSTECNTDLDQKAINDAADSGIFVSVASGNNKYTGGISSPACASGATSVGATYDAWHFPLRVFPADKFPYI